MSELAAAQIAEAFEKQPLLTDDIPRGFCHVGDGYRMTLEYAGIEFVVDHLRRDRHQLVGELLVRCELPGVRTYNGVLSHADLNISSASVRTRHAKMLAVKSEIPAINWDALVEEFCQRVLEAEREGTPATLLRDVAN